MTDVTAWLDRLDALPRLVATLRAVLGLADALEDAATDPALTDPERATFRWAQARIRTEVAAAVDGASR